MLFKYCDPNSILLSYSVKCFQINVIYTNYKLKKASHNINEQAKK